MSDGAPAEGTSEGTGEGQTPGSDGQTTLAAGGQPQPSGYTWDSLTATLPEDIREAAILKPFGEGKNPAGFEGLVREHLNVQKLIGGEKVAKPPENATPEDWDRFYTELGRPEAPEKYDLGDFAPPEGLPWDDGLQKVMMGDLWNAGLTNEQTQKVVTAFAQRQHEAYSQAQQQAQQAAEEAQNLLKAQLGDAYDGYVAMAGKAFQEAFGEDFTAVASLPLPDGQLVGNHPLFLRAFGELGKKLGEHGLIGQKMQGADMGVTPAQALAEIETLEHPSSESAKILANASHPEHKALKARWRALYRAAYPEGAEG